MRLVSGISCVLAVLGLIALQFAGYAQRTTQASSFEWPDYQARLWPGPSASSEKAKPPTLALTPAAAGTPDDLASYGGLWEGWMCRNRFRDVKVAISNVAREGARVEYRQNDEKYQAFSVTLSMEFSGDVLQGLPNNAAYLTLGMRPDGHMNVKYEVPNRWWCSGSNCSFRPWNGCRQAHFPR